MKQLTHTHWIAGGPETLEARFALRIAAALSEQSQQVPHDISERLRVAREQALESARATRRAEAPVWATAGGAARSDGHGWGRVGWRFGAALPLIALICGLILIQQHQLDTQVSAAAEIDAALLADDVPPAAYNDPGFVEFLKSAAD